MEKIKFTDIAGMLERDEMREITGGCGQTYGSAGGWGGGGGSSWASITGMGFGGGASYGGNSASSSGSSSGSSYSYNPTTTYDSSGGHLGGITIYSGNHNSNSSYNNVTANNGLGIYQSNNNHGSSSNYGGGGGINSQQIGSHSLPMTNLPRGNGSNPQDGNVCVFRNMEVVEKYFSKSLRLSDYVEQYSQTYHVPTDYVVDEGFKGTNVEMKKFISQNFNTTACTTFPSLVTAINNNQPILAMLTLSTNINGDIKGHEVTIVAYDAEKNMFKYYDSAIDKYKYAGSGSFTNALAIVSSKK